MGRKITVFGSFVVDLMGRCPHLPVPGETVKGSLFKMGPGGKGFNQAVAAHKAGADVTMVTKVGKDTFADLAIETMTKLGMDTKRVFRSEQAETGTALIMVDENTSQNEIAVIPGACNTITDEEVESISDLLVQSDYLLIQLETNLSSVKKTVEIASEKGVKIILNTAPVQPVSDSILKRVELITPNEVEAGILTGITVDGEESAGKAADYFLEKGVGNVMITMGSRGVYIASHKKRGMLPAYQVEAVDTTGAGDAFNGGLVTALAEGKDLWEAAEFANALAAISVQRIGTTPAMPERSEIDAFMKSHKMEG
ncbi:ribokinase [Lacrimispora sp.]|uniref:ribokinase n=1 Tax=Lacrimispora sp. TaxID=2719234 RepID=UPI0029E6361F|nr:ribokinase [Lacrimispora sp.]